MYDGFVELCGMLINRMYPSMKASFIYHSTHKITTHRTENCNNKKIGFSQIWKLPKYEMFRWMFR